MVSIGIFYGTTTGNTEVMAEEIETILSEHHDVTTKIISDATIEEIQSFDILLFGSSTWQDGELQDDWLDFEESFDKLQLQHKKFAAFGPGSTSYPQFAKAVEILEDFAKKAGAEICHEGLKIDGDVDDQIDIVQSWAKEFLTKI